MAERPAQPIIGEAPIFLAMLEHVSRAAPLSKPVLVVGERGTGKELVSSRLHFLSQRWEQPMVKVNCAALTESILESELFGHEAGAFTGAVRTHVGHFERASGGTLVLDELSTISLRMQEKILRVIEYGELQRVGGNDTLFVDVRIVGSTNSDLRTLAAEGKFRDDADFNCDSPSLAVSARDGLSLPGVPGSLGTEQRCGVGLSDAFIAPPATQGPGATATQRDPKSIALVRSTLASITFRPPPIENLSLTR